MRKYVLIVLTTVMAIGCSVNGEEGIIGEVINSTLIADEILHGNGEEGIGQENFVITNTEDWNNLMAKMNSVNDETPNFTETDIDFSKYMVIASFDKVRSHGGADVKFAISQTSKSVLVKVVYFGKGAATVMTQPYLIHKIEKTDLPIVFR